MGDENGSGSGVDKNRFYVSTGSGKPTFRFVPRDPMGIKVYPTGLAETNVEGAAVFAERAKGLGVDLKQLAVKFGGDENTSQVITWPVKPMTPGAVAVRYDEKKKTMTLYMHQLFAEKPALRPDETRWCVLQPDTDSEGAPCVLISLRVALERRKTTRKPPGGSNA